VLTTLSALTTALSALTTFSALTTCVLMFRACCGALSSGPFSRAAAGGRGGIQGEAHHQARHHQSLGKPLHCSHGIDS
jgi:hypothetical protein